MSTTLRPYQSAAVEALRQGMTRGVRRQLLVSPTGSGKGTLLAAMISIAVARGKRVLFIVAGRQLVDEFSQRLDRQYGVDHGVIMSGHARSRRNVSVQIASIDTLASYLRRGLTLPAADLVILDEADLARSERFEKTLAAYENAFVIGTTATPIRADGKGLGALFASMVVAATPRELIEQGYLAPYDGFAFKPINTEGIRTIAGDFDAESLDLVLQGKEGEKLAGDVIEQWQSHAAGRRTLLFAVTRRHSRELVARFNAERHHGAPIAVAEHVDGESSLEERAALYARVLRGETQVVSNVGVISRGVDWPCLEVCAFLRPTKSLALFMQQAGRVFRPSPETGKTHATFLDHAGNVMRHGLPDQPRTWSLADGLQRSPDGQGDIVPLKTCENCFAIFAAGVPSCPVCGKAIAQPALAPAKSLSEVRAVEVIPFDQLGAGAQQEAIRDSKKLHALMRTAIAKGYSAGWAGHVFAGKDQSRMPSRDVLDRIYAQEKRNIERRGVRQTLAGAA